MTRNNQEKWLCYLAVLAFITYVFSVLRLPIIDCLQNSQVSIILVDRRFSTILSGISGSLVAAYIFHFISSVIPNSKNSYIAEAKLKEAYDFTLSNICVHHLTFEQSDTFRRSDGRTEYNFESLELAKLSINAAQVFNGNNLINLELTVNDIEIHENLVARYVYITSLMHTRGKQFSNLEAFYQYFDANTIDEVQKIKSALNGISSAPPYNTKQAKHATIINAHRGLVRLLETRQLR